MSNQYSVWLREVREYQDQSRAAAQKARLKQRSDYEADLAARMAAGRQPNQKRRQ